MKLMATDTDDQGFQNEWYWDDATQKVHLKRYQFVDDNLDENKRELNAHSDYRPHSGKGATFKAASIPMGLYEKWCKEGYDLMQDFDNKELKRRLNSAEYTKLRTSPGRL